MVREGLLEGKSRDLSEKDRMEEGILILALWLIIFIISCSAYNFYY